MRDRAKWCAWEAVKGPFTFQILLSCRYYILLSTLILQNLPQLAAKILMIIADKPKEEAMSDYITKVKQLQEEAAAS